MKERVFVSGYGYGMGNRPMCHVQVGQDVITMPDWSPSSLRVSRLLLPRTEFVSPLVVPSLIAPDRIVQQSLLHPCYFLYHPVIPESATRLEIGGQLFAASMINDLIILCRLYDHQQAIEWSPERSSTALRGGRSATTGTATATSGDDEFGSPDRAAPWLLREIDPGAAQHRIAVALRHHGELDIPALEHAACALLARQGIFCVSPASSDGTPDQPITDATTALVEEHDGGDLDDTWFAEQLERSDDDTFDLPCGSPLRVRVYHRISGETVILVVVHQSVVDFWSITPFIRELEALYSELTGGPSAPVPEFAAFTRYYTWVDGSRVSTHAALDRDKHSEPPPSPGVELPDHAAQVYSDIQLMVPFLEAA